MVNNSMQCYVIPTNYQLPSDKSEAVKKQKKTSKNYKSIIQVVF